MRPETIAIDGPAGSGKSTIGQAMATRLHYAMVDTGLIYRLVARGVLDSGTDPDDLAGVLAIAARALKEVEVARTGGGGVIRVGDRPLSEMRLHSDDITRTVPRVARFERVREVVRQIQRRVLAEGPTILAGRDIGTVVAPDAELKLYLDVSLQERAARKLWAQSADELRSQAEVELQLAERDRMDRERETSPMRVAADAVVILTDKMSVDETVDIVVAMCGLEPTAGGDDR
ncbi:MAG TPA: (d)CMP kinase [Streptosporangiaceae bacterium]|nr:(d)CMP kinase [Streptosporangiaceae bacterium]